MSPADEFEPRILTVAEHFADADIAEALEVMADGGLLVFPTETVYGIGTNPNYELSVRRLYRVKGRPRRQPLVLHACDFEQAYPYVGKLPPEALALARKFWPGPMTMILERSDKVPPVVVGGGKTVGIRVPDSRVTRRIAELAKVPIAGTSANISGHLSPVTIEDAIADLEEDVDLFLDTGNTSQGVESLVIDLTSSPYKIIRPGTISREQLLDELTAQGFDSDIVVAEPSVGALVAESGTLRVVVVGGNPAESLRRSFAEVSRESVNGTKGRIVIPSTLAATPEMKEAVSSLPELASEEDLIVPGVTERNLYSTLRGFEAQGIDLVVVTQSSLAEDSIVMDRIIRRARTAILQP